MQQRREATAQMAAWRTFFRGLLAPLVKYEQTSLLSIQNCCIHPLLDPYFAYTSHLGTHTFFMLAIPILFWFGHPELGRGLILTLGAGIYISGLLKDMLCLPRPLSPPIRRLVFSNATVHLEYGFPSTHTTNAVSTGLFLYTILTPYLDHCTYLEWLIVVGFIGSYVFSVSFGRVYCGMHGLVDVFAGASIGCGIWYAWIHVWPVVDAWILTEPGLHVPAIIVLSSIVLLTVPPDPIDPCPCFDDSVAILGVVMGVLTSTWYSVHMYPRIPRAHFAFHPTVAGVLSSSIALGLGLLSIFMWRSIAKRALHRMLPELYRVLKAPYRRWYKPASSYGDYPKEKSHDMKRIPSMLQVVPSNLVEMSGGVEDANIFQNSVSTKKRRRTRTTHLQKDDFELANGESVVSSQTDDDVHLATHHHHHHDTVSPSHIKPRYDVDIVTKWIVYAGMGWIVQLTIPLFVCALGLNPSCPQGLYQ